MNKRKAPAITPISFTMQQKQLNEFFKQENIDRRERRRIRNEAYKLRKAEREKKPSLPNGNILTQQSMVQAGIDRMQRKLENLSGLDKRTRRGVVLASKINTAERIKK